jgi:hypothetical protein
MKTTLLRLSCLVVLPIVAPASAIAATFDMRTVSTTVAPSTRGGADTTHFGWSTFSGVPIDDSTPNLGDTGISGTNFKTLNGESHVNPFGPPGGNIYVFNSTNSDPNLRYTLSEQVTVATSGAVESLGTTTIIAQFHTSSGGYPDAVSISSIDGVLPEVVSGRNTAGRTQYWAKWQLPGKKTSYVFTLNGAPTTEHYSLARLEVDTHWSATTPQPDEMISPPTFTLDQQTDLITPTTRSGANTAWFGWNTFSDASGGVTGPIFDETPDIGTTTMGVRFETTNGEDHISDMSGNLYTGTGTLAEKVTVATGQATGVSGTTTIIAQAITSSGGFPGPLTFGHIGSAVPQVLQTTNAAGRGQIWVKWVIPGREPMYEFTISAPPAAQHINFDRFVVDTQWLSSGMHPDSVLVGHPARTFTLNQVSTVVAPSSRGSANSTWFGWELFDNPNGNQVDPINDATPDIGTTTTGVSIVTTNSQDHIASSGNLYVGTGLQLSEEVTVATLGTPGSNGTTTIIAQAVTGGGSFLSSAPITFSAISGVNPTVVTTANAVGKGQVWARWDVPGNAATYTFTMTSPVVPPPSGGPAGISIDKLVVDTVWRPSGAGPQPDIARTTTPAIAHVLKQNATLVTPSTRRSLNTTWFGWENLNNITNRTSPAVINDSTPDIGYTTTAGANFQTTNGETHVLSSGNLYFFSAGMTLAEQITVPTNGTVGSGFTTIILQLVSASGSPTGSNGFSDVINLTIGGNAPTFVAQSTNSAGLGQLWAKWQIPGNAASYNIIISGPPNVQHYSFDKIVVDTHWSATSYMGDSMAVDPPSITTTSPLAAAGLGVAYNLQLAASGGTALYTFGLTGGSLPAGLALSSSGLIDGTPTAVVSSNFTVQITDANGLTASKVFDLEVATPPSITTGSSLPTGVAGNSYSVTFAATNGTSPYTWSVSLGTLPAGLTLDASTGELSGTASASGTTNFTIEVEDDNGFTAEKAFSVTFFDLTINAPTTLPGAVKSVAYSYSFTGTGGTTPYTWEVLSGTLPAGITLTSAGVLSGTTMQEGDFPLVVKLTDDDDFSVTKSVSLTVHATYQTPGVNLPTFGTATVGAFYTYTVTATNYPKTFTITGLPKGLTYVAGTGVISGRPSVTGVFNIQVKAANKGGTSATVMAPLIVKSLPLTHVGGYAGIISRGTENQNLGSSLSLTTTSIGGFTAKIITGARTTQFKGSLNATAPQVTATVNGAALALTISSSTGNVSGLHGTASIEGWRLVWNAAVNPALSRQGYYSAGLSLGNPTDDGQLAIPQGKGFITFIVSTAGAVAAKGKTADGQTIAFSTALGPLGEIAAYTPLYKSKGSLLGKLVLSEDPAGLYAGNTVFGDELTWLKPTDTNKAYGAGFGPTEIEVEGSYLATAPKGQVVLGLPATGLADLLFTDGGLAASATDPDLIDFTYTDLGGVILPLLNPGKVKLSINKNTGAVSGEFTLTETSPLLTRKVPYSGQIVRTPAGSVKAVGWFLLPQIGGASTLSGGVEIQQ